MKIFHWRNGFVALASIASLFLSACASNEPPLAQPGEKSYTQCGLYYEDKVHLTTNYQKGVFIPVNTEVAFVKSSGKRIVVSLSGGTEFTLENVQEYSGENTQGIYNRTFAKTKVDLSKFSDLEKDNIAQGTVAVGMSKAAVIVAIGYPPKHQTPLISGNVWRYWHNRFNTFVLRFKDDKVTMIQE